MRFNSGFKGLIPSVTSSVFFYSSWRTATYIFPCPARAL